MLSIKRRSDATRCPKPRQTMPRTVSPALIIVSALLSTLAVVGLEDAFSAHQRHQCRSLEATHKVLALRGFTGTNHFCVDRRYL